MKEAAETGRRERTWTIEHALSGEDHTDYEDNATRNSVGYRRNCV